MFIDRGEPKNPRMPYQQDYDFIRAVNANLIGAVEGGYLNDFDSKILMKIEQPDADYEPGGQLYDRIEPLMARGARPSEEQLFDVGVDLGARICEQEHTPRGRILAYLNTCVHLDCLKVGLTGLDSSTRAELQILSHLSSVLVEELPSGPKTDKLFEVIIDSLLSAQANHPGPLPQEAYNWLVVKTQVLVRQHKLVHGFKDNVLAYYADQETGERQPDIDNQIVGLNHESMSHRKFGTKPAYIEASIGGSWVFYDGDDFRSSLLKNARNMAVPQFAAIVFHSPHETLRDLRVSASPVSLGGGAATMEMNDSFKAIDPDFLVVIGLDGRMSVDYDGFMTVDGLLSDQPAAAQAMKSEIASNFYDLSMPVYDTTPAGRRNYPSFPDEEKQKFDPIQQLLIPRLRKQSPPTIQGVDVTREVHEQDVIWYVRQLPHGWHASPEAVAEAARLEIELEPNETFVRAHKRNVGAEKRVLGYHAVRRS